MPLLKGRKNIGHNIKAEEEHGKPRKQAVAIALRTAGVPKKGKDSVTEAQLQKRLRTLEHELEGLQEDMESSESPEEAAEFHVDFVRVNQEYEKVERQLHDLTRRTKDEVPPVGGDRERAVALKKHELGLTKSQDKKAAAKYEVGVWQACTPNQERLDKMRSTLERQGYVPDYAMDLENGSIAHIYRNPKTKAVMIIYEGRRGGHAVADSAAVEPITGFEKGGGTAARSCARCKYMDKASGCDQSVMVRNSEQPRNKEGLPIVQPLDVCKFFKEAKDMRAKDVMPVPIKTSNLVPLPSGERNEVSYAAPRRAKDAESAWRLLQAGKRLEERGLLKSASRTFSEAVSAAVEERDDEARREATAAVARIRHKMAGVAEDASEADKAIRRAHEALYKAETVGDKRATEAAKKQLEEAVKDKQLEERTARAQDHSGSEPKDHLARAKRYEIGGDRARALDSYRAAASGYRKVNDSVGEAEAREGIEACQAKFAQQYDHPGRGRAKVCDSTESALRTALERTRAGETVVVDGKTVRPSRAQVGDSFTEVLLPKNHEFRPSSNDPDACSVCRLPKSEHKKQAKDEHGVPSPGYYIEFPDKRKGYFSKLARFSDAEIEMAAKKVVQWKEGSPFPYFDVYLDGEWTGGGGGNPGKGRDEHEGFAKLEHSLAHEKGVHDPKAVAAAIGRKKYGVAGMARKAAAGRAKDGPLVEPLGGKFVITENGRRVSAPFHTREAASAALQHLQSRVPLHLADKEVAAV